MFFGIGGSWGPFYASVPLNRRRRCRKRRSLRAPSAAGALVALFVLSIIFLGGYGLLPWPLIGWWLVRRVLRRREEISPVGATASREAWDRALAEARRVQGEDGPDRWRAYQVSLLD